MTTFLIIVQWVIIALLLVWVYTERRDHQYAWKTVKDLNDKILLMTQKFTEVGQVADRLDCNSIHVTVAVKALRRIRNEADPPPKQIS